VGQPLASITDTLKSGDTRNSPTNRGPVAIILIKNKETRKMKNERIRLIGDGRICEAKTFDTSSGYSK